MSVTYHNVKRYFSIDREIFPSYKIAMMTIPIPRDVEILAVDAGISVAEACRRAGLSSNLVARWKRGKGANIENIRKIVDQLQIGAEGRG